MIYKVTVKPDYRYNDCQVSGRSFSKRSAVEIAGADMNEEIWTSELLLIEEVEEAPAVVEETGEVSVIVPEQPEGQAPTGETSTAAEVPTAEEKPEVEAPAAEVETPAIVTTLTEPKLPATAQGKPKHHGKN